jgi:hypothetical protein
MDTGFAGIAGHRIAVNPDQPFGLADAAAFGDMFEDGDRLLFGQVRVKERGALAFGETISARAASEKADRVIFAVAAADGEIFATPNAMIGAWGIQAAELSEVIHGAGPRRIIPSRQRDATPHHDKRRGMGIATDYGHDPSQGRVLTPLHDRSADPFG